MIGHFRKKPEARKKGAFSMPNGKQDNISTMYGNVAYELHSTQVVPERIPRPEQEPEVAPQRRPRRRTAAQPKVRPQEGISLFAVTGFAAVALLAVLTLTSYVQLNSVYAATRSMEQRLSSLETEAEILEMRYNDLFDLVTLNEAAQEAGLTTPGSTQRVYLEMEESDNAIVYTPKEQPGMVEQVVSDLQSFWYSVLSYFAS